MGSLLSLEKPPPVVLVPPLFHRPDLVWRYRMMESSYDQLFGKIGRKILFAEFESQADKFISQLLLKPTEDPNVDITATFSRSLEKGSGSHDGELHFRWQGDTTDPNNFMELSMGTLTKGLKLHGCAFNPAWGCGAFFSTASILPASSVFKDGGRFGFRYGSSNISIGTIMDHDTKDSRMWFVGKMGRITAGCQCTPKSRQAHGEPRGFWETSFSDLSEYFRDPKDWSFAIAYGQGRSGPLDTSYNFCLELQENSKLLASYYHHMVVQRQVRNPFEGYEVVGITNYLDIGLEFEQSLLGNDSNLRAAAESPQSAMHIGASWQANKNVLLKAKLGSVNAGVTLMLKSWWQPSFMLSFTAVKDYMHAKPKFGLGIQIENYGGASYERADPNYVMVTPTKKHLAEGMLKEIDARPMLSTDVMSENTTKIPPEFRRTDNFL